MDDLMVEHVLRAVECVPPGRVTTYGAIAALVGGTARQVGAVMRFYGSNVAWWRVTNANGELPPHLRERAAAQWAREGIVWAAAGRGCRIAECRVDPHAWGRAYAQATRDLDPPPPAGRAPGGDEGPRPRRPRRRMRETP